VLARIKAVLKRSSVQAGDEAPLVCGPIAIDTVTKTVTVDAVPVSLTKKEYNILLLLMQNQGNHLSRQQIIDMVWENDTFVGDRSVDVHIARLRKKLGKTGECIVNHTGFGYIFQYHVSQG
jgi:DNA-binding response OmpR family regulator